MNRYQQIFGGEKKKNQNINESKFLLNQEGFYSPIREYKKYKKMEEFQLPDIKKYAVLKSDRYRSQGIIESEPTAFQTYKKYQQNSMKKIEEKAQNLRQIENSQQIELSSSLNNIQNIEILNPELSSKQSNLLFNKDFRLSQQYINLKQQQQQQSKLQAPSTSQFTESQTEQQQGYNVIFQQKFRVSSLEKLSKQGSKIPSESISISFNQSQNKNTQQQINNESINSNNLCFNINNSSLVNSSEKNKYPIMQQKNPFLSCHIDHQIQNKDKKIDKLNIELLESLRSSLQQLQIDSSYQQIQSERNGLRCKITNNNNNSLEKLDEKLAQTKRIKNRKIKNYSNSIHNNEVEDTLNILFLAQKQVSERQIEQKQNHKQNNSIEQILLNKNPYLNGQISQINPQLKNQTEQIFTKEWENQLVESEIVHKRSNQNENQKTKSGGNSPLFGSTRFLNFLPHHIKKKKIQSNIQLKQQENVNEQFFQTEEEQKNEINLSQQIYKQQYNSTSDTFNQTPPNYQSKQSSQYSQKYKIKGLDLQSKNNLNNTNNNIINEQPINSYKTDRSYQYKQNYNMNKIEYSVPTDNRSQPLRIYGSEKSIKDSYPQSSRVDYDGYLIQLNNNKTNKIKIEDQNIQQNEQSKQQRLTFTQFIPWENPRSNQINVQSHQNHSYIQESNNNQENKRRIQNKERSLNQSEDEKRFIDFDINDYFSYKDQQ